MLTSVFKPFSARTLRLCSFSFVETVALNRHSKFMLNIASALIFPISQRPAPVLQSFGKKMLIA